MIETRTIPEIFESRKRKILAELSIPDAEYTDLSPKGSVDEGIRDLIQDINGLPGLVTTSSCAGRISVFLEGRKKQQEHQQQRQFAPSGGKGAGKWLYVSHDPLKEYGVSPGSDQLDAKQRKDIKSLHDLFGMVPGDGKLPELKGEGPAPRLVRFHYDPMILHIMTATLQHAHPVLSAASSAGFRESGLQSLRCLEGDDGPSPIVAVRSAGLSLESVIGYFEDNDDEDDATNSNEPVIRSLVTEEYLQMLVEISNERFSINTERKERFRTSLLDFCSANQSQGLKKKGKAKPDGWEDPEKRRERKKAEGLMRKRFLESQTKDDEHETTEIYEEDQ